MSVSIQCSCCDEPVECPYCGSILQREIGVRRGYTACDCATLFLFRPDPYDRSLFIVEEAGHPGNPSGSEAH